MKENGGLETTYQIKSDYELYYQPLPGERLNCNFAIFYGYDDNKRKHFQIMKFKMEYLNLRYFLELLNTHCWSEEGNSKWHLQNRQWHFSMRIRFNKDFSVKSNEIKMWNVEICENTELKLLIKTKN